MSVRPVHNSGTLPLICASINLVSIGCVCARSKLQKGLDSYQEEDLSILRDKWSDVLAKRRDYLDDQLQKIMNKEGPQNCCVILVKTCHSGNKLDLMLLHSLLPHDAMRSTVLLWHIMHLPFVCL